MKVEHHVDSAQTLITFPRGKRAPMHSNGNTGHAYNRRIDKITVSRSGQVQIHCGEYPVQVLMFDGPQQAAAIIRAILMSVDAGVMAEMAADLRTLRDRLNGGS